MSIPGAQEIPDQFPEPVGENMQAVRDAIEAMRTGDGSYDELKVAVQAAKFAPRPRARSLNQVYENWDYPIFEDTFNDTVQAAMFQKILTQEQMEELLSLAQFVEPEQAG